MKKKISILKPVLVSLSLFAVANTAWSQDRTESKSSPALAYIGALLGSNNSTSSEGNLTPTLGLTLGAKFTPSLGVGFLGSYYGQVSSGSLFGLPIGASTRTLILAGQVNYFVGGLHLGGEIGAAISSWSGNLSNIYVGDSAPAAVFGPVAGYDLILGKSLSLGVEGHYLISTARSGVNNLQLFAALKFWQ